MPTESITRENVHDLFGMVLQDTWLFEGTLRDNLTYGKSEVSDERLWEIIEKTGLTHFVRTLPQGLDTVLNGCWPEMLQTCLWSEMMTSLFRRGRNSLSPSRARWLRTRPCSF